jgi:adenylate kinase family enzyme
MIFDRTTRLVVIGNSGSGKSMLSERVGASLDVPVCDLDHIHWIHAGRKRDEDEAKKLVAGVAAAPNWIIEGVFGWLAEVALLRATNLIWLDLNWAVCREGLLTRGMRRGMTTDDQEALIVWAEAYWTRTTPSSFGGHEQLFRTFSGEKLRLTTRAEVADLSIVKAARRAE